MPKLKQPQSLEKMALDVLLKYVVLCCDQLSVEGSLDELRQEITLIKENLCNRIPWHLLADFCSRFLDFFYWEERPVDHLRAALEILMDIEIIGLQCKGPILNWLDFHKNGHRLRRIKELDLDRLQCYPENLNKINFENLDLSHLRIFIFPSYCTDLHLKTIGRTCPKLEVLRVPYSRDITNEGLRALSPCSELRVVDVVECFGVSHIGLTYLLSAHAKLEDFSYGYDPNFERPVGESEPDMLSGLDWSVECPSMKRFVFENNQHVRPEVRLQNIVQKFPNLVYLRVNCMNSEDLSPLKYLNKLTGLEINFVNGDCFGYTDIASTWQSIMKVLTSIGANITTLSLSVSYQSFTWQQPELDFIFDTCPNIELFRFEQGDGVSVIPPFRKLKELIPCISPEFQSDDTFNKPLLKFAEMSNLETLSLREFRVNYDDIESIMLDDNKFPNLSVIQTNWVVFQDLVELKRIARCNNLDFRIENKPECNWYPDTTIYLDSSSDMAYDTDSHVLYNTDDHEVTFCKCLMVGGPAGPKR